MLQTTTLAVVLAGILAVLVVVLTPAGRFVRRN
jgi:hypothetical protein